MILALLLAAQSASIPSNFDVNSELVPSWGTGAIPASAKPDLIGAFRFICNASHLSYDDPIVYPGKPGASHLHQFFGNTGANAKSTYRSLRTMGQSTCMSPLNRSAYWIPAMLTDTGKVLVPDYVSVYYKRFPATSSECQKMGKKCLPIPRGLRFVMGYNMKTMSGGGGYFNCDGATAKPGHYLDLVTAQANCPAGNKLGAVIGAPFCWSGKVDSPDHRSHLAFPQDGADGVPRCDAAHPYVIPQLTLGIWYTAGTEKLRLSSDDMMPGTVPGTTFHADYWEGWDDPTLVMWDGNCLNLVLNCSGGDLGNGKQLRQFAGFSWTANPRLVDPPAR